MGLFDRFKKYKGPYNNDARNIIYDLLFCDNLDLFGDNVELPDAYPFDIILSRESSEAHLEKVRKEENIESRVKILAYFKLILLGKPVNTK